MAELARPSAKTIPTLVFTPPNPSAFFSRGTKPLAPDTTGASNALAMAGLAEELGKLPGGILDSYNKGQAVGLKTAQQEQAADFLGKRMASGDLSGLTVNSDGSHSWSSPKPATAQRGDLFNFLQGQHFDGKPEVSGSMDLAPSAPSRSQLPANGEPSMIPLSQNSSGYTTGEGSVFGLVPDGGGGFKDDPNDLTDAHVKGFSAQKGAWGHNIKDPNLVGVAITPAELKAAGINPNDAKAVAGHQVEVVEPNGKTLLVDIVDKNGTAGRADFTLAAYRQLGGPEGKNGGLIPNLKYRIVPRGASAVAQGGASPDLRNQIGAAAEEVGRQLVTNDLGDLQASNTSGPVPTTDLANTQPKEQQVANRVARVTVGRDPQTGAMIYAPTPTDVIAVTPTGDKLNISPAAGSQAAPKGMTFPNLEAVRAAGLDPEGAKLNPDGSFTVETFKAGGTDERGRGKITDAQKNKLVSSAELTQELNGMQEVHRQLYADNKAGPIMGRFNSMRNKLGIGDGEFVEANGTIKVANFKIARLLNGPGVLTDADIARAQEVAPTLNETPESFAAKMNAVKKSLRASVESWMAVNAGQATPEQEAAAQRALETLGEPAAAPSSGNPLIDAAKGKTQPGGAAQEILRDFQSGKFDSDPRKPAIEKKLREMGLLSGGSAPGGLVTAAIEG